MISFGVYDDDMDKATKARVEWKVQRKQCLQCKNVADGCRGLCKKCENKWKVAMRHIPKEKRLSFDRRRVAEGKILAVKRGPRSENPFI